MPFLVTDHVARPRRSAAIAAVFVLAVFALAGCSKRITSVDASAQVEGTPSASQLVVQQDAPSVAFLFRDTLQSGPDPSNLDYVIATPSFYQSGPGTVRGSIFDYTPAGDYQIFRQASSGGFQSLKDFPIHDSKQWVDSQSELYQFVDDAPPAGGGGSSRYLARGIVNGVTTKASPLTNLATPTVSSVGSVTYTGNTSPTDSLFTISWTPFAGAAGYWLQVFQYRQDLTGLSERILAGAPEAIFTGKSTDLFVAFMPSNVSSFKLGDPAPPGGRVLYRRQTFFNFFYFVRVSAVGPSGELLAYTGAAADYGLQQFADQTYLVFPLGAKVVAPSLGGPTPNLRAALPAPAGWHERHPSSRVIPAAVLPTASGL